MNKKAKTSIIWLIAFGACFDMLGELVKWVESQQAPDRIIASRMQNNQAVRTRPLCMYPAIAVYSGSGSTDDAKSFVCETPFEYGTQWIK
jgi:hypothetical protein